MTDRVRAEKSLPTTAGAPFTRRAFIKLTGAVVLVAGIGGCGRSGADDRPAPAHTPAPTSTSTPPQAATPTHRPATVDAPAETSTVLPTRSPGTDAIPAPAGGFPPADGYLLVDVEKCQGCASCMLACSLIHEGVQSLSLSRIQVLQDSFVSFPGDLTVEPCRQCVDPACVKACPTGALDVDGLHGNVRRVDADKCVGCGLCRDACPYTPSRAFLAADGAYGNEVKSRKCDLCANAPYHWDVAGGGLEGKQACIAVCPVGAIAFTSEVPEQDGEGGYVVNLRDESWAVLGYPSG